VFSLVDAVFGGSLEATLDALTLGSHIRAAILHREGTLGTVLDAIMAFERADWTRLDRTSEALAPLSSAQLAELAIAAAAWAGSADQSEENAGLEHFDD
jgi:c-di-GMP-related signal transduction protein